jgi:hypothetical protein
MTTEAVAVFLRRFQLFLHFGRRRRRNNSRSPFPPHPFIVFVPLAPSPRYPQYTSYTLRARPKPQRKVTAGILSPSVRVRVPKLYVPVLRHRIAVQHTGYDDLHNNARRIRSRRAQ